MVSNTKLFPEQKQYIRDFLEQSDNLNTYFEFSESATIMVSEPFSGSDNVWVTISLCNPSEKKFRKSVGKYICIRNFENGHYITMTREMCDGFIQRAVYGE